MMYVGAVRIPLPPPANNIMNTFILSVKAKQSAWFFSKRCAEITKSKRGSQSDVGESVGDEPRMRSTEPPHHDW
jgi:hypothetical protein